MRQKLTTHISRAYFPSAKQNINTELYYSSLTKLQNVVLHVEFSIDD